MDLPNSKDIEDAPFTADDLADELNEADVEDMDDDGEEQYDNSQVVFARHEGSVFVVDIDKDNKYVVSGGEDDKAFVWELESGEVILEIKYHESSVMPSKAISNTRDFIKHVQGKDSVEYAGFSVDSSMVAVGDLSGVIKVFYLFTKKEVWTFETADLQWLEWHPKAPVIMAGTQDGNAWLWKIPSGDYKIFSGPGCPCTCGKILPDGKTAALGYSGGSIRIVDLKTQELLHNITKGGHRDSINYLACSGDGQSLISGALDGVTLLTSTSTGKVNAVYSDTQRPKDNDDYSVEGVGISDSLSYVAVASLDTYLYIWDMKTGHLRTKCKHPEGVTRLTWDNSGMNVFTGCTDGICRQWNARTGELISTFVGHTDQILDISLSKDNQIFLSASADGTVRAYDIERVVTSSN